jgi:class 3 adenylate cyclase
VYVDDAASLSSRRACELERRYDVGSASLVIQDVKPSVQAEAWLGMLLTLVVCGLFVSLVTLIEKDLADLVLLPLAKMTNLIDRISRRPLDPIDVNALRLDQRHGLEPTLLLQTISKIGALVKVGLGEAGADIITRNLRGSGSDFQINLSTSGKIVDGIFVFCDIRCFTDTTECLQEEVMVFVNKIAHILHDLVTQYGGSPNKNVGDAFLLVWKLDGARGPASTVAADRALYCVLKFIYEMVLCQDYVCSFSSAASQRLFNRMPDYRVNIGFGLHVGWAVEGAIGSVQKIDASYISPHVSLSETLQDMTKEYGVTILFSDNFYNLLSSQARYHCRQVDAVGTDVDDKEGGASCMGLYTYDCDVETLRDLIRFGPPAGNVASPNMSGSMRSLGSQSPNARGRHHNTASPTSPEADPRSSTGTLGSTWRSLASPSRRTSAMPVAKRSSLLEQAASRALHGPSREPARPYDVTSWEEDQDLHLLRRNIAPGFRTTWNFAMNSYLAGRWAAMSAICLTR